jgi:hypothetical protein
MAPEMNRNRDRNWDGTIKEVRIMKLSVRLSNAGMMSIIGLVIAVLLLTDISARREHMVVMPGMQSSSGVVDKVVTKEFVLVDDNGNQRARIGMNDVNGPAVQLFDTHGTQRAMLRLNKDDVPSLRLYDGEGKLRSVTGFNLNTLDPQYILFDANGNGRPINNANITDYSSLAGLYRDEDVARNGMTMSLVEPPSSESLNSTIVIRTDPNTDDSDIKTQNVTGELIGH